MSSMKKLTSMLAGALLAFPAVSAAGTLFRFPMSMLSDQCGNGGCAVSNFMDHGGYDYACGYRRYAGHTGTDFYLVGGFPKMDYGVWVISAASGTLVDAVDGFYDRCDYWNEGDPDANCGLYTANYMIMQHADGRKSKYWHLRKYTQEYAEGSFIPCGNWIAKVGSSGASEGPHLHFEFWDPSWGTDDPYAGSCGGPISLWTSQGSYWGLPGITVSFRQAWVIPRSAVGKLGHGAERRSGARGRGSAAGCPPRAER